MSREERRRNRRAFRELFEVEEGEHVTAKQIRELMPSEIMEHVPVNGMNKFLISFLGNDIDYMKHCGIYILRGYKLRQMENEKVVDDGARRIIELEGIVESMRQELLEMRISMTENHRIIIDDVKVISENISNIARNIPRPVLVSTRKAIPSPTIIVRTHKGDSDEE